MRRILVLVVAVLALAACTKQAPEVAVNDQVPAEQRTSASEASSEGGATGGGGGATWVAVDIAFDAAPESVPAGETTITLDNQGQTVHNVTINDEVVVEAQAGSSEEGTFNFEAGETYEYICSVPGHESLMNGEITVE